MQRLLQARWTKNNLSIAFICLVVGFLLSMQVKSVFTNNKLTSANTTKIDVLADQISEKIENEKELLKQIDDLKKQAQSGNSEANRILQEKMKKYELASGATAVKGQGVQIVFGDSVDSTMEDPLVHYQDLLMVINELRTIGAEAVSINDVRLIGNSTIRCVGPTILIDDTKYPPPYKIKAIGNPDDLVNGLKMKGGIYDRYVILGYQFDLTKQKELKLPMYKKSIEFKYAKEATN